MLLRRPDTCEEAQAYVGTTLKKWWEATAVSDEGWYSCSVQNISDDVIQLDDGTEQEGLWLLLRCAQHCSSQPRTGLSGLTAHTGCWVTQKSRPCCARCAQAVCALLLLVPVFLTKYVLRTKAWLLVCVQVRRRR